MKLSKRISFVSLSLSSPTRPYVVKPTKAKTQNDKDNEVSDVLYSDENTTPKQIRMDKIFETDKN